MRTLGYWLVDRLDVVMTREEQRTCRTTCNRAFSSIVQCRCISGTIGQRRSFEAHHPVTAGWGREDPCTVKGGQYPPAPWTTKQLFATQLLGVADPSPEHNGKENGAAADDPGRAERAAGVVLTRLVTQRDPSSHLHATHRHRLIRPRGDGAALGRGVGLLDESTVCSW